MLPILPLELTFRPQQDVRLPAYTGSLWRGALGSRLRSLACITGQDHCKGCQVVSRCAYGSLFETPAPPVGAKTGLTRYAQWPHPYVLSPCHRGGLWGAEASLQVRLTLLPSTLPHLPTLLPALRGLELRGVPMTLSDMAVARGGDGDPEWVPIGAAELLQQTPIVPSPPPLPNRAEITLCHPLRLRRDNRYLDADTFEFVPFFTALMRRISMLAHAAGRPLEADFQTLKSQAAAIEVSRRDLSWYDWQRYSARQRKSIPMGGIIGTFQIHGPLAPLWPWLWFGQWVHVGKGAVMGLGRYQVLQR